MSILLVNHINDKLDINVGYCLFAKVPFKFIVTEGKEGYDKYKLTKRVSKIITIDVHIDDFQSHALYCLELFVKDVKQHIELKDDKLIYFISAVDKENDNVFIPVITTDFVFCHDKLYGFKNQSDEASEQLAKYLKEFKMYRYNHKIKQVWMYA